MDLKKLGSLFMVGFQGESFTPEVRDILDELSPCGLILFSRNIRDPFQLAELNRDLQVHALSGSSEGLFLGVDQEAGRVRRLKEPFTRFPPALRMAGSENPDAAVREFARVTARELRLVGFNVDFVPVLDVLASPATAETSVIGDRSFGPEPEEVSRLGAIVTEAMRAGGVVPCAKHFPGHGGTAVDSHVDLPVDERSPQAISTKDLAPFRSAIELNVEMIMTAHVLYKKLDPYLPATLSEQIIGNLLRREMGYMGVVITDDLDMGAVSASYSLEESTVRALQAGVDVLLVCHSVEKALVARSAILHALKAGDLAQERVEQALARIRNLKSAYRVSFSPCEAGEVRRYFV